MSDNTERNGSLFARWTERKRAVAEDEAAALEAEAPESPTEAALRDDEHPVSRDSEETDEEVLERLGLPDPDTLEKGDDFSAFMGSAIPTRLRNRALRKLWLTNPVLANLDELVDYGEDFTDAATVIENLQTAYQVGRGFMTDEDDADDEVLDEADDISNVADTDSQPGTDPVTNEATASQSEELPETFAGQGTNEAPGGTELSADVESGSGAIPEAPDEAEFAQLNENPVENISKPRSRMRFRFDNT
jgi:hypothetical protein